MLSTSSARCLRTNRRSSVRAFASADQPPDGFTPTMQLRAAGTRPLPAVSVPMAKQYRQVKAFGVTYIREAGEGTHG